MKKIIISFIILISTNLIAKEGFFEISDPMLLDESRESVDRNGVTTYEHSFYPQDSSNYDYIIAMLKQKYDALA